MPEYIDSHAHTNFDAFDEDRDQVYARAREAGVVAIVEVGVGLAGSLAARDRAALEEMVFAAFGLHPTGLESFEGDWGPFCELVRAGSPVAVGECGLDYYWMKSEKDVQAQAFRRQIALAQELSLPYIVHCRDAEDDMIELVSEMGYFRGVVHCFGGSAAQAERLLSLGMHLSFCGNVTYRKNTVAHEAARVVPLDRLLLETDSPFLSPQGKRGQRNEPAHVVLTAAFLAEHKGVELSELAAAATASTRRLFSL